MASPVLVRTYRFLFALQAMRPLLLCCYLLTIQYLAGDYYFGLRSHTYSILVSAV